eukprot:TRINITY_DN1784_c0_g1_i2.p1 TRINITY_DN1784_c0_g1~~TRINITY_DN1784_c0_g1_i2.p1  ORF type:complete len:424 (+),score=4.57 TRINITY_DN1784_c0_g1_i2:184-1455(+)
MPPISEESEYQRVRFVLYIAQKLYWYFVICGYGIIAPWNVILTCMHYFKSTVLALILTSQYEPAGYSPEFTFPVAYLIPVLLGQALMLMWGQKIKLFLKLLVSYVVMALSFFPMVFIAEYIENLKASFALEIVLCISISFFQGILEAACFSIAGTLGLGGQYMSGVLVGFGASGVITTLLQFASIGIFGSDSGNIISFTDILDPYYPSLLLYSLTFGLLLVSIIVSYLITRQPDVANVLEKTPPNKPISELWDVARKVLVDQGKNVIITAVCTLMVFPGVVIAQPLTSLPSQWSIPMIVFIFNVFDITGNYIAGWLRLISRGNVIWATLARVISPVLICLIGYETFNGFFVAEWWIIVNVILFALTNGLLITSSMMFGGDNFEDKTLVGSIMSLYLALGLMIGSVLAQGVFANLFQLHITDKN